MSDDKEQGQTGTAEPLVLLPGKVGHELLRCAQSNKVKMSHLGLCSSKQTTTLVWTTVLRPPQHVTLSTSDMSPIPLLWIPLWLSMKISSRWVDFWIHCITPSLSCLHHAQWQCQSCGWWTSVESWSDKDWHQKKRKKMWHTFCVSWFLPISRESADLLTANLLRIKPKHGKHFYFFTFFPDVSIAPIRKLKQVLWYNQIFRVQSQKRKVQKCTPTPRLM